MPKPILIKAIILMQLSQFEWFLIIVIALTLLVLTSATALSFAHAHKTRNQLKRQEALKAKYQHQPRASLSRKETSPTSKVQSEKKRQAPDTLTQFELLTEDDLSPEQRKMILEMAQTSPKPRRVLSSLLLGEFEPKKFAKVVSADPEIAARLLRMVNSSAFHLSTTINSVQHAVTYLGASLVKSIALKMTLDDSNQQTDPTLKHYCQQYWLAGFVSSLLCLHLGRRFGFADPSSLSTRALLSFIGNLTMVSKYQDALEHYSHMPSLFDRTQYDQEYHHTNSAVVGACLAKHWELPHTLTEGIKESLVPMVTPVDQYHGDDLRELTLCYATCRLAELFAFNEHIDLASVDFRKMDGLEFIYLPDYIEAANLQAIPDFLQDPVLKSELNKVMQHLMHDTHYSSANKL